MEILWRLYKTIKYKKEGVNMTEKNLSHIIHKITSARFLIVLILTIILSVMAVRGQISSEVFVSIYSPIVVFYFSTKERK